MMMSYIRIVISHCLKMASFPESWIPRDENTFNTNGQSDYIIQSSPSKSRDRSCLSLNVFWCLTHYRSWFVDSAAYRKSQAWTPYNSAQSKHVRRHQAEGPNGTWDCALMRPTLQFLLKQVFNQFFSNIWCKIILDSSFSLFLCLV